MRIDFKMQREQADYLLALGRKYGWGLEINEVIRTLLAAEGACLPAR